MCFIGCSYGSSYLVSGCGLLRRTIGRAPAPSRDLFVTCIPNRQYAFQQLCFRRTADAQGTPESAASHRQSETCIIEMQMRTPAGQFARRIGDQVEDPARFAGPG